MKCESGIGNRAPIHGFTGSRAHGLTALWLTVYGLLLTMPACGADTQRVGVDCFQCHNRETLIEARGDDADGPREWMLASSEGLRASTSPFTGQSEFLLEWPRRGRHPEFTLESDTCFSCHPVDEAGLNHSLDAYPAGTTTQVGDCAAACHLWIPENLASAGPGSGDGAISYSGPSRPHEMLTRVRTAHTSVYEEGYLSERGIATDVKVRSVRAGCAGCHSMNDPRHGAIATCTDCHSLSTQNPTAYGSSGGLHGLHLLYVKSSKDRLGLGGTDDCAFCHSFQKDEPLPKASCYNCHLSGHQPVNAEGKAHFWP